ncbi:MAG: peptidoglycan-binding domain-containing protein [Pseudomonadota bacterium]
MAILAEGSTGGSVKKLQGNLNKVLASGPKLKTSGTFDAKTKDAVTRFQKKAGLAGNGVADSGTMKALKTHIEGLEWSLRDPADDKGSISTAVSDLKTNVKTILGKLEKAETACRAAADLLKTNRETISTKVDEGLANYETGLKALDEMIKLKAAFDAAKKAHDLAGQKAVLKKAKPLDEKVKDMNAKAYPKIEEAGQLRADCETAVDGLAKLDVKR